MMPRVLIISNPTDEHTARVAEQIRRLGGDPILFYPEELGQSALFSACHPSATANFSHTLTINDRPVSLEGIYSIWYRRPRLQPRHNGQTHEGLEFAREEWRAALEGAYALLDDKLWVSHPDRLREAARKPRQLHLACTLGLPIPRTLITNDPDAARAFADACDGRVIGKATGSGWVYSEDGEDIYYVLTNRIAADELQADDEIRAAPLTLQEEIPKAYEIRANVVGDQILAVRIDSQSSPESELDWRRYDLDHTPYSEYRLPSDIEQACLELTRRLGLEFGAIDLICTPDDRYIFLEINGNGQFLWAEEHSGVGISVALANLLVGNSRPLRAVRLS